MSRAEIVQRAVSALTFFLLPPKENSSPENGSFVSRFINGGCPSARLPPDLSQISRTGRENRVQKTVGVCFFPIPIRSWKETRCRPPPEPGFSFDGEQYVAITSFTDRPCWYWHVASCSPHQAWETGTGWKSREGTWNSQQAERFFEELLFVFLTGIIDTMATDGYSWSTFVKFSNNGTYIYSSGYMAFPKNYRKFTKLLRRNGFRERQG